MEEKEREKRVSQVKEQIAKLEEVNVESLSDEDLESVAGGCSVWCCTTIKKIDEEVPGDGGS